MKTLLQDQPIVTQAYGKYKQFNQDERLRAIDEAHQRTERDMEIARNMKNDGFDAGIISRITGLSLTEIEWLNWFLLTGKKRDDIKKSMVKMDESMDDYNIIVIAAPDLWWNR